MLQAKQLVFLQEFDIDQIYFKTWINGGGPNPFLCSTKDFKNIYNIAL